jgi:hypothetical protein
VLIPLPEPLKTTVVAVGTVVLLVGFITSPRKRMDWHLWRMFKREHEEYLVDRDRYLQRPPRSRANQPEGVAELQRGAEAEH